MAGEPVITVIGNLTADPELRYTPNGAAVASFTIASTPRTYDRQASEWKDGETLFLRASVWRDYAEHVANSLTKGTRVIAQGRLRQRSYQTREGENRTSYEIEVDEIGPALRYATARVERVSRGGGSSYDQGAPPRGPQTGGGQPGGTPGGAPSGGAPSGGAPAGQPGQQGSPWGEPASGNDGWNTPGVGNDDTPF